MRLYIKSQVFLKLEGVDVYTVILIIFILRPFSNLDCFMSSSLILCPDIFLQAGTENPKDGGKKKAKGAAGDAGARSEVSW